MKQQQGPNPQALQLQHLLRGAGQADSVALGALLGRKALQVAAASALALPRGTARPCPHCGSLCSGGTSEVRKLPRSAVRRQLKQRGPGSSSSQAVQRWLQLDTCPACNYTSKRLLQRLPQQQQQQPGAKQRQQQGKQQQQQEGGQQQQVQAPQDQVQEVPQHIDEAAPEPMPNEQQQQQQEQGLEVQPAAGSKQGASADLPAQTVEQSIQAELPLSAQQLRAQQEQQHAPVLVQWQDGTHHRSAMTEQQEAGEQLGPAAAAEGHPGSPASLVLAVGTAEQPASRVWPAEPKEQEEQEEQAAALAHPELAAPEQAQADSEACRQQGAALGQAADLQQMEEQAEPVGEEVQPAGEHTEPAGEEAPQTAAQPQTQPQPQTQTQPGGAEREQEAPDSLPPAKRRRLQWSDEHEVRLIARSPKPKLKKILSWQRIARTWKAAQFTLDGGGSDGSS